jgi:protein TonB
MRRASTPFPILLTLLSACVPRQAAPKALRTQPTSCADAQSGDTAVYTTSQINERPKVRTVPKLTYPPEARHRHLQGRVVVRAVVNVTGEIDQPSLAIAQSVDSVLDAEARQFVAGATLWPGCRNGVAVRVRIDVPVEFVSSPRPLIGYWTAFGIGVLGGVVAALIHGR